MSEFPPGLLEKLREFSRRLFEELEVSEAYLFGSLARGDWMEDSDLDVVVVSQRFRGLELGRRYALVKKLAPKGVPLEALTYTPEEFEEAKKQSVILQDVMEYAIPLSKFVEKRD
ncbi:MAG: nucleotidyltransferase domain-containing protein [Candidatus Caldarchaeum sp.]|nr:nucleotidyltransferase domain-containing protein [Candidatus Caldarchaeum sp.]